MLTGRNSVDAGTASEAIAKIVEGERDWSALPTQVPAVMRRLGQRCLTKDPKQRLHDIADARIEIADALAGPEPLERREHPAVKARWPWVAVATAATVIVAAALLVSALRTHPSTSTGLLEFPIDLIDTADLGVAVSPNGRQVAIATYTAGGVHLWLHALDTGVTRAMPGTQSGLMPFWSPDGSAIGFFAMDGKVKRVEVADGSTTIICNANGPGGGSWNADGVMLFSDDLKLFRVPLIGGTPVSVDIVDEPGPSTIRTFPQFLPDGRHFIYHAEGRHGGDVRVASLDSRETKHLVESDYPAVYAAPSHLLFLRGRP